MIETVLAREKAPNIYWLRLQCETENIENLPVDNVAPGSLCYVVDDGSEYVFYNGQWVKKIGGSTPSPVVNTGCKLLYESADNLFDYNDIWEEFTLDASNITSMRGTFSRCGGLRKVTLLNTDNVEDMYNLFSLCTSLEEVNLGNTSNVTNMSEMFYGCSSLTTIPQLDTSNVTDMSSMFENCSSLTTIPQLDTSKVKYMIDMFSGCSSLTGDITLDLSSISGFGGMIDGATQANFKFINVPSAIASLITPDKVGGSNYEIVNII